MTAPSTAAQQETATATATWRPTAAQVGAPELLWGLSIGVTPRGLDEQHPVAILSAEVTKGHFTAVFRGGALLTIPQAENVLNSQNCTESHIYAGIWSLGIMGLGSGILGNTLEY